MRKVSILAAAVAAVVVAGGGVSGCSSSAIPRVPAAATESPTATKASPQDEAAYDALLVRIYGTPAQVRKGEQLVNHKLDLRMSNCMASAGFGYVPAVFAPIEVTVAPADLDLVAPLGELSRGKITEQLAKALEATKAAGDNPPWQKAKAEGRSGVYDKAANSCFGQELSQSYLKTDRPIERTRVNGDAGTASRMEVALTGFEASLKALQDTPAAQQKLAGYRSCLSRRGLKVKNWLELVALDASKFDDMQMPWAQLETTTRWRDAMKFERSAEEADRFCRRDVRSWAIHNLRQVVDRYSYDPAVALTQKSWEDIEREFGAANLA